MKSRQFSRLHACVRSGRLSWHILIAYNLLTIPENWYWNFNSDEEDSEGEGGSSEVEESISQSVLAQLKEKLGSTHTDEELIELLFDMHDSDQSRSLNREEVEVIITEHLQIHAMRFDAIWMDMKAYDFDNDDGLSLLELTSWFQGVVTGSQGRRQSQSRVQKSGYWKARAGLRSSVQDVRNQRRASGRVSVSGHGAGGDGVGENGAGGSGIGEQITQPAGRQRRRTAVTEVDMGELDGFIDTLQKKGNRGQWFSTPHFSQLFGAFHEGMPLSILLPSFGTILHVHHPPRLTTRRFGLRLPLVRHSERVQARRSIVWPIPWPIPPYHPPHISHKLSLPTGDDHTQFKVAA